MIEREVEMRDDDYVSLRSAGHIFYLLMLYLLCGCDNVSAMRGPTLIDVIPARSISVVEAGRVGTESEWPMGPEYGMLPSGGIYISSPYNQPCAVSIYDYQTGARYAVLGDPLRPPEALLCYAFSRNGNLLTILRRGVSEVDVYSVANGIRLSRVNVQNAGLIRTLAVSIGGDTLAVGSNNGFAYVYDVHSGKLINTMPAFKAGENGRSDVRVFFDGDERSILTLAGDKAATWSIATGEKLNDVNVIPERVPVWDIVRKTYLIPGFGSNNEVSRYIDAANGKLCYEFRNNDDGGSILLGFTPNGQVALILSANDPDAIYAYDSVRMRPIGLVSIAQHLSLLSYDSFSGKLLTLNKLSPENISPARGLKIPASRLSGPLRVWCISDNVGEDEVRESP